MRPDGSPSELRETLVRGWRDVTLYLAAGVAYVAIGLAFPEFLFSWVVATGYLLVCTVVLPALLRLLR